MFHLTFFARTSCDISPAGFTALTAFGGAELRRPTLASQLLHLQHRRARPDSAWNKLLGGDENMVLTFLGGTVLTAPTMAEEYAALAGLLRSGVLAACECDQLLDELSRTDSRRTACRTMTVFGSCVTRAPSAAKERKALDIAHQAGQITDAIRSALEGLLGSPPESRARLLYQLVTGRAQ